MMSYTNRYILSSVMQMNTTLRYLVKGSRVIILLVLFSCNGGENNSDIQVLKEQFLNPPEDAMPGVYWYFMDGNLSREGMTADLESMKQAGIGSVLFLEVNVGVPRGKVDFL